MAKVAGSALGAFTLVAYMIGSGRAFETDAAITMWAFVDRPISWPFTRQIWFNNHPIFSFIENAIADVTGSTGEVVMRVAPAVIAALAVGLLAWRLSARLSLRAGLTAGALLAFHPLLTPLAREVRGYGLATLAIVVMGIAVFDARKPVLFGVAAFLGIGTHLFVVVPFVALLVWLLMVRELTREWRLAAGFALLGGVLVYVQIVVEMQTPRGTFDPRFPLDLGWELLGSHAVALVLWLGLLAGAMAFVRAGREWFAAAAVLMAAVAVEWVLAPSNLDVRFGYWAVPCLAALAAVVVHRAPRLVPLAAGIVVVSVVTLTADWTADTSPNRELAERAEGACGVSWTLEGVTYYREIPIGWDCPRVALFAPDRTPEITERARREWPAVCWRVVDAEVRGRTPADCEAVPR